MQNIFPYRNFLQTVFLTPPLSRGQGEWSVAKSGYRIIDTRSLPHRGMSHNYLDQGMSYIANSGNSFLPYKSRATTSACESAPVRALCGDGSFGIPQ